MHLMDQMITVVGEHRIVHPDERSWDWWVPSLVRDVPAGHPRRVTRHTPARRCCRYASGVRIQNRSSNPYILVISTIAQLRAIWSEQRRGIVVGRQPFAAAIAELATPMSAKGCRPTHSAVVLQVARIRLRHRANHRNLNGIQESEPARARISLRFIQATNYELCTSSASVGLRRAMLTRCRQGIYPLHQPIGAGKTKESAPIPCSPVADQDHRRVLLEVRCVGP